MKVETLLEPRSGGECEDALVVSRHVYGVFDGVTAAPSPNGGGRTGGALAADIASSVFGERTNAPLAELVEEANRRIAQAMEQHGLDPSKQEPRWGTTAAVVRLGRDAFEWALVGDSVIIVVYADGSATPVRERADGRQGILDGQPAALGHLCSGRSALAGVRHILLATDGLLVPESHGAASVDHDLVVQRFLDGGLPAARLDTKDDVAAIAISFPPPAQPPKRLWSPRLLRRAVGGKRSSGVPSRRRRGPRSS
ncbi:protein phosphatase 2C domain-containing protein [Polyangium aurulentum]|uniref:protein phosphatase 2C domain-containing protein n=1 Tax=Polyangium aurulentum TaxID=2567896 RepID=UPI00146A4EF4|nr:protein phosphatase 2C domain-containing protein [Polyangium aurulentum]UQA62682.1 protein phosphatase 2C domain-containing protein [Polyangium aurulentum]